MNDNISKLIRFLRYTQECTQETLSEKAGLDYRHYQKIESGKVSLRIETLERITTAMNFSLRDFFHLNHLIDPSILNKTLPKPETCQTLVNILLKSHHEEVFKGVISSIINYGDLLHKEGRSHLEDSPIPIIESTYSGEYYWRNKASSELFTDTCFDRHLIPVFKLSEKQCPNNCCIESTPVKKVGSLVHTNIYLNHPNKTQYFFWGKIIKNGLVRYVCNTKDHLDNSSDSSSSNPDILL